MAELNRQDLISDDALSAPAILAKNMEEAVNQLKQLKEAANQFNTAVQGSGSIKKASEDTQKLVTVNKELEKVNAQIAVELVKQNEDYIKLQKTLQANREETKKKIALGNEDAKIINRQNASLQQLEAALKANRAEYAKFSTEEKRASKEGQELLKVIQQQDADVKELRNTMGQAQANVGNYEGAIKSLREELKSARGELVTIANTLGTESKEFVAAAERAGALKDQINEVEDAIRNAEASPFENLSNSLGDVGNKLLTLDFGGAASSARQFANASRAITFKEALTGIKDFGSTLTTVGRALLTNPLFILAAVIGGIVVAMVKFRDSIVPVKIAMDVLGKTFDFVTDKLQQFTDWLGLTTFEQDKKAKATEDAASREVEAVKKNYDTQIKLAEAAGKDISKLEIQKQEAIIAASKNAIASLVKDDEEYLSKRKSLNDEIADAEIELQVLRIRQNKKANELIIQQRREAEEKFGDTYELVVSSPTLQEIDNAHALNKAYEKLYKDLEKYRDGFASSNPVENFFENFGLPDPENTEDYEKIIEKEQELRNRRIELVQEYVSQASAILGEYNENLRLQSEEEIARIEAQREYELQLAGDNKNAQDAINKKFNAQVKKAQKEQAERDKRIALFNIALNTAVGITSALTTRPPNIPLSIVVGILGAIQLATAAGIKLPAFEKGTDSAPGGLAIVGEKGAELIKSPDGKYSLSPSGASLMNLEAGSKVFTHDETVRMLAASSLNNSRIDNMRGQVGYNFARLEKRFESLEETIRKKKETHINVTRRGLETMMKNADTRTWFLDNIYG